MVEETVNAVEVAEPVKKRKYVKRSNARDFEKEKDAILEDYPKLKLKEFYAKYHLSSSRWTRLKAEWNILGKRLRPRSHVKKLQPTEPPFRSHDQAKTSLPPFNESWGDSVKIAWLDAFVVLNYRM